MGIWKDGHPLGGKLVQQREQGALGVGFDGCVCTSFLSPLRVCGLEPCPLPVSRHHGVIGLQLVFDVVQLGGLGAPVYLAWLACRGAQCCLSLEKLMGAWGSGMGKACPGLEILKTVTRCTEVCLVSLTTMHRQY